MGRGGDALSCDLSCRDRGNLDAKGNAVNPDNISTQSEVLERLRAAVEAFKALPPEAREAMLKAQREDKP